MTAILLGLAWQVSLDEGPAVPLPCKDPLFLTASTMGRFVVVAGAKTVHVLDGESLKLAGTIDFECTAVGFDAKDMTLTVVGTQAVRFETKEWKETFRADLPDVELRKAAAVRPRIIVDLRQLDPPDGWLASQAMVAPDGAIYYRSKGGRLMSAKEQEGRLVGETLTEEPGEDSFSKVDGVLATPPGPMLVRLGGITGVVLKRKVYTLARSSHPLAVGLKGAEVPVVTRKAFSGYHSGSWKNLGVSGSLKDDEENRAAVFDAKRGRFYIARGDGLRFWDGRKESEDQAVEGVTGKIRGLALDGGATRLYGVDGEKLRVWRLKD